MQRSMRRRWGVDNMEQALNFERELSEIKAKQAAAEEQHKTIFRRLDKQDEMIESVHSLARSVDRLTQQQSDMRQQMDDMSTDLDEIKSKPAKRWETVTMDVIKIVVAALVGFMLSKLGVGA